MPLRCIGHHRRRAARSSFFSSTVEEAVDRCAGGRRAAWRRSACRAAGRARAGAGRPARALDLALERLELLLHGLQQLGAAGRRRRTAAAPSVCRQPGQAMSTQIANAARRRGRCRTGRRAAPPACRRRASRCPSQEQVLVSAPGRAPRSARSASLPSASSPARTKTIGNSRQTSPNSARGDEHRVQPRGHRPVGDAASAMLQLAVLVAVQRHRLAVQVLVDQGFSPEFCGCACDQHLVDTLAVEVDDLEAPALPVHGVGGARQPARAAA